MKKLHLTLLGVVGAISIAALAGAVAGGPIKEGSKAPSFSAKGSDGKTYSLDKLTKDGPVYLYFVQETCPINAQAVRFYNEVYNAHKGKAKFVAIFDGDETAWKRWSSRHKASYMALMDPDLKIIRSYQAQRSPWVIEVAKDGSVEKIWPGYSKTTLNELNSSIAESMNTKAPKINVSEAPNDTRFG